MTCTLRNKPSKGFRLKKVLAETCWFNLLLYIVFQLLPCLVKVRFVLVVFPVRNVFLHDYINLEVQKIQLLLRVLPSPNQTNFNHAFLIIWSSDLNVSVLSSVVVLSAHCNIPVHTGTVLQSKAPTNPVAERSVKPPAGVLGRMPLCMHLISSDCVSFITIFHGSLNSQILILIIFSNFSPLYWSDFFSLLLLYFISACLFLCSLKSKHGFYFSPDMPFYVKLKKILKSHVQVIITV